MTVQALLCYLCGIFLCGNGRFPCFDGGALKKGSLMCQLWLGERDYLRGFPGGCQTVSWWD